MTDPTPDVAEPAANAASNRPLVRHSRRQGWGRALMLWERDEKRGYQFEDGKLRVFTKEYFALLKPAKVPDPLVRHKLLEKAQENGFVIEQGSRASGSGRAVVVPPKPRPSLDDQILVFGQQYPEGFGDPSWIAAYRRPRSGRALKRHREPAIAHAAELLARERLDAAIAEERFADVFAWVLEVMADTDLVSAGQLEILRGISIHRTLAEAMRDFLHDTGTGELEGMTRIRRRLAQVGVRKIPWPVLTAPRALLHPNDHICVRASVIRAQARNIMPDHKPGQHPNAEDYSRSLELVMVIRERLTSAGLQPRDLLDVADFMWSTLKPAAKDSLDKAMVLRLANASRSTVATAPGGDDAAPEPLADV